MHRLPALPFVLPLCTLIGCTGDFMPMGDYVFVFELDMPADTIDSIYQAFICEPDESFCGRRKVDTELYEPDRLITHYAGDEYDEPFVATGWQNKRIEAGYFWGLGAKVGPDKLTGFYMNDLPFVSLDIPPRFQITEPSSSTELSRASLSSIRIEWSPSGQGFPMRWKFFPADNDIAVKPCDMLAWGSFEGEGEDLGFLDIPIDIVPIDLPPEGCKVAIRVSRVKSFDLPEGIQHGFIHSSIIDGMVFKVLP